jgi:hypothetical protein
LGKVTEVYAKEEKVKIRFYHSGVTKNASSGNNIAMYTLFTGGPSAKFDWVTSDRILIQVPKLTTTGRVKQRCRDRIKTMLFYLEEEKKRKALATKESGEGEGEGDEGDAEGDDEVDDG